jgi:mannose-6-phosphate isomerase-like protein (cupin superfamily)
MLISRLAACREITAGDGTRLRELLHPGRGYAIAGRHSLAHATLAPGQASTEHRLRSDEVYYILQGKGEMHVNDEVALVQSGDAVEIPPGSTQWIRNVGQADLCFLCIVDPAWRAEDEEILG